MNLQLIVPALYTTLARVYHEIYPYIFDYENEFDFYNSVFQKFHCHKILEIACGTGILAKYLIRAGYDYLGVDLNEEMLNVAREANPTGKFLQGDMRNLKITDEFDATLIAGKSVTHLLTNTDIFSSLRGIRKILRPGGIVMFDAYDANAEFGEWIDEGEQEVSADGKLYRIRGKYTKLLDTGWTARWQLTYTLPDSDQIVDTMDIRSYTMDEIRLFLTLVPFDVKVVEKFTDNVFIAIGQKIQGQE